MENHSRFKLVKVNIDKLPQIANGLKVQSVPAVFLVMGGKVVDSFVGIPQPEKLQDFFNKAVIMDQIAHDENVQTALMDKAQELLQGDDLKTAFEILIDLYQYDALRLKYEHILLSGMAYCMALIHKDYARAKEMIELIPEELLKDLGDFYKGLYDKTKAQLAANPVSEAPAEQKETNVEPEAAKEMS
jgi:putative thioredoxin